MQTVEDLERRAGIAQTPAARIAFWKPFAHLSADDMLADGIVILKAIAAQRGEVEAQSLAPEELEALIGFRACHGRYWKTELRRQWERSSAGPDLQRLRNRLGPSWLASFRLPK